MPTAKKPSYIMHPRINEAYRRVHNWFDEHEEMRGYQRMTYKTHGSSVLARKNPVDAAFNFSLYFPTHYFKVRHALENEEVIGLDNLAAWLRFNPYLTVVDIGCGDGAGSVAVVETVLRLREAGAIDPRPIEIRCIGVDKSIDALEIYRMMLDHVYGVATNFDLNVKFLAVPEPLEVSSRAVVQKLQRIREDWEHPALNHTLVIQSNLSDMLEQQYKDEQKPKYEEAKHRLNYQPAPFGNRLAFLHQSMFEMVPIDHLHIITVDTKPQKVQEAVQQMFSTIQRDLGGKEHQITLNSADDQSIRFENPKPGYWRVKEGKIEKDVGPFLIKVCHIHNYSLHHDQRWTEIISTENLELAWARSRHEIRKESFYDEIEIRLFEYNLENNLKRLQAVLKAYAIHAGYLVDTLQYQVPKKPGQGRPRGLTWLEEEILIVAIIQVIGRKLLGQRGVSFAYRLSGENTPERGDTEYLYQRWSEAWQEFREAIRAEIKKRLPNHPNTKVYETDISAFFERIIQDNLTKLMGQTFDLSPRIQWLLELLVSKELQTKSEQDIGRRGLVQGSTGSGFLANIYMSELDSLFPATDSKKRSLFRYVDDTVVVIPEPDDVESTKQLVMETFDELDLKPNLDKTNTYPAEDYLQRIADDQLLTQLNERFEHLTLPLLQELSDETWLDWFRESSKNEKQWWATIRRYYFHLTELGLFYSIPALSRRMAVAINRDSKNSIPLIFPDLPVDDNIWMVAQDWAAAFREANSGWVDSINDLRTELIEIFTENFDNCTDSKDALNETFVTSSRRLRFAGNRLAYFGWGSREIVEKITALFCEWPWLIRYSRWWIEELARQGYRDSVWQIVEYYQQQTASEFSSYLEAVALRAVRFFPGQAKLHDERLLRSMFSGSSITRLMATESWLLSAIRLSEVPFNKELVEQIFQVLHEEDLSNRLRKNYLLVLGILSPLSVKDCTSQFNDDPLLLTAYQVAHNGLVTDVFQSVEPAILRERYYSAQPPSIDDGGPSSF